MDEATWERAHDAHAWIKEERVRQAAKLLDEMDKQQKGPAIDHLIDAVRQYRQTIEALDTASEMLRDHYPSPVRVA